MKRQYGLAILAIAVLLIAFEVSVIVGPLSSYGWLPQSLQGAALSVALLAAVIALHSSDRKPRHASAGITVSIAQEGSIVHLRDDIHGSIGQAFADHPATFTSYRVQFHLRNLSGFDLRNPTLTFRLPLSRQHPHRLPGENWVETFNSNLYNSQESLRIFQFGDTALVSNSNLPYWNTNEELMIWIRMVLDYPDNSAFAISVSVNSDNIEGATYEVQVDPGSRAT